MKTALKTQGRLLEPADYIRPDVWRDRLVPELTIPEGARLEDVRIVRVYPSRPEGFGVQAEITLVRADGGVAAGDLYLSCGMKPRSPVRSRIVQKRRSPLGFTGLSHQVAGGPLILHTPDYDDALPVIADATRSASYSVRLKSLCAADAAAADSRWKCTLGNYRPRRRCTLLYRPTGGSSGLFFAAKLFRRGQAAIHAERSRQLVEALQFASDGLVVAPRVLDVWPDWNAVIFEGLHQSVRVESGRSSPRDLTRPAAEILARLHASAPDGLPTFAPSDELHATGRWVELADRLGKLRPAARRIWSAIRHDTPREAARRQCMIHRDFYASQILPLDSGWGIVDFDTAALGDPEQDVANFIGHSIWECVGKGGRRAEWLDAARTLIDQYQHVRSNLGQSSHRRPALCVSRIRFYLTSSLLRVGIIHSLRTGAERRALVLHRIASDGFTDLCTPNLSRRGSFRAVRVQSTNGS